MHDLARFAGRGEHHRDLDERVGMAQRRDDGGPRRRVDGEERRVDGVHRREVARVFQEDVDLDGAIEARAGGLSRRFQVGERLPGLGLDVADGELPCGLDTRGR